MGSRGFARRTATRRPLSTGLSSRAAIPPGVRVDQARGDLLSRAASRKGEASKELSRRLDGLLKGNRRIFIGRAGILGGPDRSTLRGRSIYRLLGDPSARGTGHR